MLILNLQEAFQNKGHKAIYWGVLSGKVFRKESRESDVFWCVSSICNTFDPYSNRGRAVCSKVRKIVNVGKEMSDAEFTAAYDEGI